MRPSPNFMYGPLSGDDSQPDFVIVIETDDDTDQTDDMTIQSENLDGDDLHELAALEAVMDLFAGMSPSVRRRHLSFLASWLQTKEEEEQEERRKKLQAMFAEKHQGVGSTSSTIGNVRHHPA